MQYSSSPSLYFCQEKERALYESNLKNIDEKVTYIGFYFSCLLWLSFFPVVGSLKFAVSYWVVIKMLGTFTSNEYQEIKICFDLFHPITHYEWNTILQWLTRDIASTKRKHCKQNIISSSASCLNLCLFVIYLSNLHNIRVSTKTSATFNKKATVSWVEIN